MTTKTEQATKQAAYEQAKELAAKELAAYEQAASQIATVDYQNAPKPLIKSITMAQEKTRVIVSLAKAEVGLDNPVGTAISQSNRLFESVFEELEKHFKADATTKLQLGANVPVAESGKVGVVWGNAVITAETDFAGILAAVRELAVVTGNVPRYSIGATPAGRFRLGCGKSDKLAFQSQFTMRIVQ